MQRRGKVSTMSMVWKRSLNQDKYILNNIRKIGSSTINTSSSGVQHLGVTPPISTAEPRPEDEIKTKELETVLMKYDLLESDEELARSNEVLCKLNMLARQWIKGVSIKQNMPPNIAENVGGRIYTFGSYRLGVHNKGADIDTLCVAPRHVDRCEFFSSFVELLKEQEEVKDLRCIEGAYVPVIKMKFDGIEIDMLFARLALKEIPEDLDLSNVNLLRNLDLKCVRSINGYRVLDEILHLVPKTENFKLALRAIKLWAKKHGVYSNKLGFLSGVSLAMLLARTCQLYPNACAATLVHKFFLVFSQWEWPTPVLLKKPEENHFGFEVWDPRMIGGCYHLMPIITPTYPQQNSTFNVSSSTRTVIQESFKNGLSVMNEIMCNKASWDKLFEPVNFFTLYKHYIVVTATAPTKKDHLEWYELIESKIRTLVTHLERHNTINIAHANPDAFISMNPEFRYQSTTAIGLKFSTTNVRLDLSYDIQQFVNMIYTLARSNKQIHTDIMKMEIKHIPRKELSKYLPENILIKRKKETEEHSSATSVYDENIYAGNMSDVKVTKILGESNSKDSKPVVSELNKSCTATIKKRPLDENSQDGYQRSKRRPTDTDSSLPPKDSQLPYIKNKGKRFYW